MVVMVMTRMTIVMMMIMIFAMVLVSDVDGDDGDDGWGGRCRDDNVGYDDDFEDVDDDIDEDGSVIILRSSFPCWYLVARCTPAPHGKYCRTLLF